MCVCGGAANAAALAANELERMLCANSAARVGLATGRTFIPVFQQLRAHAEELQLQRVRFTHLDEYEGVNRTEVGSMARELRDNFFDGLNPAPHFDAIDGLAPDAAQQLAANLKASPVQFQFAGIGTNGHIAFNEPGTPFSTGAHRVQLHAETLQAQSRRFSESGRGLYAITTGPRELLQAQRLVLLATGRNKAAAVQRMLEGPIDSACPASLVRMHSSAMVILDEDAASLLTRRGDDREALPARILDEATLRASGPVLCVSPHPDDASISCGALLAMSATAQSVILCCTTGARAPVRGITDPAAVAALRETEVLREAHLLGAKAQFLRGRFYDSTALESDDVARLTELLLSMRPEWILTPSAADPHPTHRLTRHTLEAALHSARAAQPDWRPELWTFEGPWFQHERSAINTLLHYSPALEAQKLAAVRAHVSQMQRVPFDEGAIALARLRGVMFSETHFGGLETAGLREVPLLECYVRERLL